MTIRERLAGDGPLVGAWCLVSDSPGVGGALARAGLDFVYLDLQHSAFGLERIAAWCDSVRTGGALPIVRPESSAAALGRLADIGAGGLIVPNVVSAEDARAIVNQVKHPPVGSRSVASSSKTGAEEPILVVQLESVAGCERMGEILAVPGIDVAVIGRNDLSAELGVPGELEHPWVTEWVDRLILTCRENGIVVGLLQPDADSAWRWYQRGVRWLPIGSDLAFLMRGASENVSTLATRVADPMARSAR